MPPSATSPQSKKSSVSFFLLLCISISLCVGLVWRDTQTPDIRLWAGKAPGALGDTPEDQPAIRVFLPESYNNTRTAIVICPGGAYAKIMSTYEGESIARVLNNMGVAAFVLKYRITPKYHHPAPTQDVLRAIRYVRQNDARFGIAPNRIGVMGFSAGGHLASLASTHYDEAELDPTDPTDKASSRPDFTVLGYPIISLEPPFTHEYSAQNFLGDNDTPEMRAAYSTHLQVNEKTPPAFLFHTQEDKPVIMRNSLLYYNALQKHGIPSELHIYEKGEHGAGLGDGLNGAPDIATIRTWPLLLQQWLIGRGLLN